METKALARKTPKEFFADPSVQEKAKQLLGERSVGFITSILQVIAGNSLLAKADPASTMNAAMTAALLNLPINQSLGYAYIVPYGGQAQFQIGYKGLIQLAHRSGQFKRIAEAPVYEGQLIEEDPLLGNKYDWKAKTSDKVIGYVAYFRLSQGFEQTLYMSAEQVQAHGKRFSKTFGNGPWKTDFEAMARKTVLKLLLLKYAPLSVDLERAIIADQAVVKNVNAETQAIEVEYPDNGTAEITKEELQELLDLKREVLSADEISQADRIIDNEDKASYNKLKTLLQSK